MSRIIAYQRHERFLTDAHNWPGVRLLYVWLIRYKDLPGSLLTNCVFQHGHECRQGLQRRLYTQTDQTISSAEFGAPCSQGASRARKPKVSKPSTLSFELETAG